ncbi:hypothetical protein [Lactococcus allomyrinae]|uniref:Uncharacterized protein n=1 Tax=Lactococcus allomyrinae TaxID=2419773 RepID=A0A387B8R3_9LACT|nr:hypothetical protein [Lactococcus allomyrinae]AYG00083.1 hypothetical protein D7I46_02645 [Lactococcus allomyrinae]
MNLIKIVLSSISWMTVVIITARFLIDRVSATPVERNLENNYQRFFRHLSNIIEITLYFTIIITSIYTTLSEKGGKQPKNSISSSNAVVYIIISGFLLVSLIYWALNRWYQEDFQQKLVTKLKIDGEEQEFIVLKRILKDSVLLQPIVEKTQFLILPYELLQNHLLVLEKMSDVKIRRIKRIYETWNITIGDFKSSDKKIRKRVSLIFLIVLIIVIIVFGTTQQSGWIARISFLGTLIIFFGFAAWYQHHEYKLGKNLINTTDEGEES